MALSKKTGSHQSSRFKRTKRSGLAATKEHDSHSLNQQLHTGWQCLSELEVAAAPTARQMVQVWLTESLKPLELQEDFMNRVLKSAQRAIARVMRAESSMKSEHIHVILFVPPKRILNGRSWGFFHVVKTIDTAEGAPGRAQSIAFYLYLEEQ